MSTDWPEVDPDAAEIPGSRPRVEHTERPTAERPQKPWDAHPKVYRVGGQEMELFNVYALSRALQRQPQTLRKWERQGFFPVTNIRQPRKGNQTHFRGADGNARERLGRRLYPRSFIEGAIKLADECGILSDPGAVIKGTDFVVLIHELWEECRPR